MRNNKSEKSLDSMLIGSLSVFLVPIILGALFFNQLPDEMAIHFDGNNIANGFAPKWITLFGIPVFLLAVHFITITMIKNDPKKANQPKVVKNISYWLCPVLSIFMQVAFISYGLGKTFDMTTYVTVGLGILFMVLGNYLPKSRQNYTIGYKLPWTLSSEDNWNKTHRLAGWLWILCGLLIAILSLMTNSSYILFIIIVMAFVPMAYSFVIYKKEKK